MKSLRAIGYWRNEAHPELPDPHVFVDPTWEHAAKEEVADYLGRGLLAKVFMGHSTCRICGKRNNGGMEYTDGTYIWPSGLAHYVKDHNVRLPEEFVRHAQQVVVSNEDAPVDWAWWSHQHPGP